jgi:DNA polymerase I-like protein with 3'-5' exonuclease and polymerase domains
MTAPKITAIDTETTGTRPFQGDRATVVSFADDTGSWSLPAERALPELRKVVDSSDVIVMHNSPFDRAVFSTSFGVELEDGSIYDTQAADWLLDENADHRLKEGLGVRMFGVNAKAEKDELRALMRGRTVEEVYRELREGENEKPRSDRERATLTRERAREIAAGTKKGWEDLTYEDLREYAEQDAHLTLAAYWKQQELLEEDGYAIRDLARQHAVGGLSYRITKTGIRVDQRMAEAGLLAAEERVAELGHQFEGTNLKSPKQVQELLFDTWGLPVTKRTKSGGRSTDKDALEALSYDPRALDLLEYRRMTKQVDAYYLPLLDRVGDDGRIHPSLNPWRTVTGRFSCSGPNLQTIPRESTSSEIRKVFIPEKGLVLTEWDLSQIEVRVAAAMSKEPALISAYAAEEDIYQALADEINVSRHVAKTVILSAQYGVGSKTLAATLARGTGKQPDVAAARRILGRYWRAYPQLDRLMKGLEEVAKRRGYLPLWKPGRRRLFKSPSNPFPRYYTALNAAIQGGAAELLKDVLLELEPEIASEGRIVLTVHDSIVIEHSPGAEERISAVLAEITGDVSPYDIPTPWERKTWRDDSLAAAA